MIAVDLFAGGGGASLGIANAGLTVVLAVNHDEHAIAMHAANHPNTVHLREDVFNVSPRQACGGRLRRGSVDLLWLSPSCTHHSRAKGGVPKSEQLRSLAWVGVEWANEIAPRVIALENVPEWLSWGPLDSDGQPIISRKGETFRAFVGALQLAGYRVEWRVLVAADYGVPTTRKRLFLIARRDGQPITWPAATHGKGLLPYETAGSCIDWTIPVPSIFGRKKPLADATQRRIAEGMRRYVLTAAKPFIVNYSHGGRVENIDEPMNTITATPDGGDRMLVLPTLVPSIVSNYGNSIGSSIGAPLPTVTAGGMGHSSLSCAFLAKHYTGVIGQDLDHPLGTVTAQDHHSLILASLSDDDREGARRVAAFLCLYYGSGGQWSSLDEPMKTIVTKARMGLVTVTIEGRLRVVSDIGLRMLAPRELARAQGFPDSYLLAGTKTQQIARIGNSVCPPVAQAIVEAQFGRAEPERLAAK